jgi:beta-galactosidase
MAQGGLVSYRYGLTSDGGRDLLRDIPQPMFWHAPTADERGWGMPNRDGQWLLASRYAKSDGDPTVESEADSATVNYRYLLPTMPQGHCDVAYRVFGSGRVEVTLALTPGEGLPDLPEFGLMLVCPAELGHLTWYGEGPAECYSDRRNGARLGVYHGEVATQLTAYLRPQEAGSHTQVRWATVTDDRGAGLRFECPTGMEFSALPWTPFEIENARHAYELPPIHHTVIRASLARRGVGGDQAWGAMTHDPYLVPCQPMTFRFAFQGLR